MASGLGYFDESGSGDEPRWNRERNRAGINSSSSGRRPRLRSINKWYSADARCPTCHATCVTPSVGWRNQSSEVIPIEQTFGLKSSDAELLDDEVKTGHRYLRCDCYTEIVELFR